MTMEQKTIHVQWEGPFAYSDLSPLKNEDYDYGVYQIYASHPVYGSDVLLYIGKADRQTFGVRIAQEGWSDRNGDGARVQIYIGRLSGSFTPEPEAWSEEIDLVEKLLINSHWPAGNSQNLNNIPDAKYQNIHILNWGKHRDLMPEVSGARWSSLHNFIENYDSFGNHELENA